MDVRKFNARWLHKISGNQKEQPQYLAAKLTKYSAARVVSINQNLMAFPRNLANRYSSLFGTCSPFWPQMLINIANGHKKRWVTQVKSSNTSLTLCVPKHMSRTVFGPIKHEEETKLTLCWYANFGPAKKK